MGVSMNYMEQVAQMLGVNLEKEFKLEGTDYKYKFSKDGMKWYSELYGDWVNADNILVAILIGWYKIKKPILDEAEKEYLRLVIKPFREQVNGISKNQWAKEEYICIDLKNDTVLSFPGFQEGTKYKGMEANKLYSLEELGL